MARTRTRVKPLYCIQNYAHPGSAALSTYEALVKKLLNNYNYNFNFNFNSLCLPTIILYYYLCPGLCSPGPPGSAALSPHEALVRKLLNN